MLGDNAYNEGSHQQLDSRLDHRVNPAAAEFISSHVDYFAYGNHDMVTDQGQPSRDNYSSPIPVAGVTSPVEPNSAELPENNYSWDYGNVHFLTFDSNSSYSCIKNANPDCKRLDGQLAWAEQDLNASSAEWKVVYAHHPLFSFSGHQELHPRTEYCRRTLAMLSRAGVDMFLAGHAHNYQRSNAIKIDAAGVPHLYPVSGGAYQKGQGLVHIVAGTGGVSNDSYNQWNWSMEPLLAAFIDGKTSVPMQYGFLKVDVSGGLLEARYIGTEGDTTTLDEFTIQ